MLGHLPPYLIGGSFPLDAAAARHGIRTVIAEPLGLSIEDAARGILSIADNHMVGAIRVVTVERGYDPRDFTLLAFGGAGPLHAGALARLLGIRTILIPPAPGVLSALGLLVSNLKAEFTRTCLQPSGALDLERIASAFAELDAEATAWLRAEHVPQAAQRIAWSASLRYQHQGFELFVPWCRREVSAATVAETIAAFHEVHERLYTFAQHDTPVEIVTLRVDAEGVFARARLEEVTAAGSLAAALMDHQEVHLDHGPTQCPVYDRGRLPRGTRIDGPAILTQLDTTTLILANQIAQVDHVGNLIITEQA